MFVVVFFLFSSYSSFLFRTYLPRNWWNGCISECFFDSVYVCLCLSISLSKRLCLCFYDSVYVYLSLSTFFYAYTRSYVDVCISVLVCVRMYSQGKSREIRTHMRACECVTIYFSLLKPYRNFFRYSIPTKEKGKIILITLMQKKYH